jgi:hypothetical protein
VKKIPSLFVRDFEGDPRFVLPVLTPACEWVFRGEGIPTRKRDGTACMVDEQGRLWRRYDAKNGKTPPAGFQPAQAAADEITGHWPGWLLVGAGPQDKWYHVTPAPTTPGTYELCGPKFQNNAEDLPEHIFFRHGGELVEDFPTQVELATIWATTDNTAALFAFLRAVFSRLSMEGVVWHHFDGRMVKLKRSDFGYTWPLR